MEQDNDELTWQRDTLETLLLAGIQERRRKRRWGIFFKLLFLSIVIALFILPASFVGGMDTVASKDHTAMIDVRGEIFDEASASADNIIEGLNIAARNSHVKGIVLRINSPGGSPVQAAYVYREIQRLHKKYNLKIVAVCTDLCASAAYYIASACDQIVADRNSLVGSIGSIMSSFGFVDTLAKLGIERRLLTSGAHKGFLDPFSPLKADDVSHAKLLLAELHQQFIKDVKVGRGKRLQPSAEIFSGLIWSGQQAKTLGLIDQFGSASSVARDVFKAPKLVDYTRKPNYFEQVTRYMSKTFMTPSLEQLGFKRLGVKVQ